MMVQRLGEVGWHCGSGRLDSTAARGGNMVLQLGEVGWHSDSGRLDGDAYVATKSFYEVHRCN